MSNLIQLKRREFIKYQLRLRGTSLAEISRELGITLATVSQVCSGIRTSKRVLNAVATKLGITAEELIEKLESKEDEMA